jgi:hypothetical protein
MAWGRRVQRLRDMADEIERLPESPHRDRLLSEVRSRAVDVDTGMTPRAMRPLREPPPALVLPRPAKRDGVKSIGRVVPRTPAPAVELARPSSAASSSKNPEQSFLPDDRLSLEDTLQLSPQPHVRVKGKRAVAPWTFGLRA